MTTSKTMKNRLYMQLFLLLGICALVSCKTEIDDYFDSSASQRIENEILKYRELLSSPQYGWAMEYFPGGTTKNHSKKMKTSEFQRIQRFSFCFNCAKHADLGISIVPNSWLFFEPLKKATI